MARTVRPQPRVRAVHVSPSTGPQYLYSYDNMGRLNLMQDSSTMATLATASYGVASEVLGLTYFGVSETRTYNNRLQLTSQYVPGAINMAYNYTAGANVGQISSSVDGILGETLNYTYSSLYKLQGVSGAWSQSYTYDGFGNLTSKSPAGWYSAYAASFDPATNRQVSQTYDANGNQTSNGTYDVSNRLVSSTIRPVVRV
jgi:hypothetical protein